MSKHTPAPWRIYDCEFAIRVGIEGGDGNTVIAFGAKSDDSGVYGQTTQQAEANARLIASAPELLEALKVMIVVFQPRTGEPSPDAHVETVVWDNARQAIAKAEGTL